MNDNLIRDPVKRAERSLQKEEWVLNFLRDEVYSTTGILAGVMCVNVRGARSTLARMEKKGFLVRDAVMFMGMKAVPLWGITSTGILSGLTYDEVKDVNLRYHSPGKVKPLTIAHSLDTQKCRLYCEYEENFQSWTPDRLLPGKGNLKGAPKRWPHYPDAVGDRVDIKNGLSCKVAIEIERTRKTPGRYVAIIKAHFINIEKSRYSYVWYFCQTQRDADSLHALFVRLMEERNILFRLGKTVYSLKESIDLIKFKSIEVFE